MMAVFTSKINSKSDFFNKNKDDFTKLIKKMEDIHSRAEKVSERRRSKFIERGQLTPRERLSKLLDKDETLSLIPNVKKEGLRGGVIYHDGQFDDARMAISLALTADNEGATLINYAEVLSFIKENDLIKGIEFKDRINGKKKNNES